MQGVFYKPQPNKKIIRNLTLCLPRGSGSTVLFSKFHWVPPYPFMVRNGLSFKFAQKASDILFICKCPEREANRKTS